MHPTFVLGIIFMARLRRIPLLLNECARTSTAPVCHFWLPQVPSFATPAVALVVDMLDYHEKNMQIELDDGQTLDRI